MEDLNLIRNYIIQQLKLYNRLKKENLELRRQKSNIHPFTCYISSTEDLDRILEFIDKLQDEIARLKKENMELKYSFYCSLKLPGNILLNEKIICENYFGKISYSHITIFDFYLSVNHLSYDFTNRSTRNKILEKIKKYLHNIPITPGYKILGLNVPDSIRRKVLTKESINKIHDYKENTECFLALELFSSDLSGMYTDLLRELNFNEDVITPKPFYTKEDYKEFSIHITLAKFSCINNAVNALKEILKLRTESFLNSSQIINKVIDLRIFLNENKIL
jgi:hypothetical protein